MAGPVRAYFVLDLVHDKHAAAALRAYAASCKAEYPALASDLSSLVVGSQCAECGGDGLYTSRRGCRESVCEHTSFPTPCPKCLGWGVARKRRKSEEKR